MPAPISFPSTTPNFELPLLFTGQSQKEFFVNQSLSMIDALIKGQVLASQTTAPAAPNNSEIYRVTGPATDEWAGFEDHLAVRIGGAWQFVAPFLGQRVFDAAEGIVLTYASGWIALDAPTSPQGGAIVDNEARLAIDALITALTSVGILK